ncbi:glycosyltransferase [Flavobacteriaceae bacterium]|nr:glycosyltransferase [Flavobacteriaceae bacterium]
MKQIAVVILNWNGAALLERFLPTVLKNSGEMAHIYVADNGSTDSSIALLKERFSQVTIIEMTTNNGFAGGYNLALKQINEPLFCLLNSDVSPAENWLVPILAAFNSDSQLAIAQPKILDELKKTHFEYAGAAGGYLDALGYPFCRGRIFQHIEQDLGQYNDNTEIFWATGACMFIRKEVFLLLNGFDETYFAHQEEIDLCWRARNLGYKVMYLGSSTVFHLGGSTLSNMNPKKTFLNFRNSLFSILKNMPLKRAIIVIFVRLILDGIAGVRFIIQGKFSHCLAIIHAHIDFYKEAPSTFKKKQSPKKYIKYFTTTSIVWSHYIKGLKKFSLLVKD